MIRGIAISASVGEAETSQTALSDLEDSLKVHIVCLHWSGRLGNGCRMCSSELCEGTAIGWYVHGGYVVKNGSNGVIEGLLRVCL